MVELITSYSFSQIPYISYEALEDYAESVIADYAPERLTDPAPIDVEDFIKNYLGLEIAFHKISYDSKVLGLTVFHDDFIHALDKRTGLTAAVPVNAGTVVIDTSLKTKRSIRRFRFTCTHEGSHWLLHRKAFAVDNLLGVEGVFDNKSLAAKKGRNDYSRTKREKTDTDRMERQADFLAAAILMPKKALRIAYRMFFDGIGEKSRVVVRSANQDEEILAKRLTAFIADVFGVSRPAALIRLEKLHAIVDKGVFIYADV
jgi:Zn-dependent peptidase ImmA (M78 family)